VIRNTGFLLALAADSGRLSPSFRESVSGKWVVLRATRPFRGRISEFTMKAKIIITPKKAVVDPQGKSVQNALAHIGYTGVSAVHVGKYLEIELTGGDAETARKQIDDACHKLLSNPVIEDYRFEIE
jgi:phosphoribosylformylglycinamidine synthase PurS subunit